MINLTKTGEVKTVQSNLRAAFGTSPGIEVMKFLEQICGWYDFSEVEKDRILIAHGKRQVLATIKTLLDSTPEQIVALTKEY
ncbi:MAG TPA: hypothetical protein VJ044_19725 [Candidatus Hodarchaeales archaeon]|nr:hypothetical protein [Candidatus Hodarchaeales archaeon]